MVFVMVMYRTGGVIEACPWVLGGGGRVRGRGGSAGPRRKGWVSLSQVGVPVWGAFS